jgi:hypothetical protein
MAPTYEGARVELININTSAEVLFFLVAPKTQRVHVRARPRVFHLCV